MAPEAIRICGVVFVVLGGIVIYIFMQTICRYKLYKDRGMPVPQREPVHNNTRSRPIVRASAPNFSNINLISTDKQTRNQRTHSGYQPTAPYSPLVSSSNPPLPGASNAFGWNVMQSQEPPTYFEVVAEPQKYDKQVPYNPTY